MPTPIRTATLLLTALTLGACSQTPTPAAATTDTLGAQAARAPHPLPRSPGEPPCPPPSGPPRCS